MAIITLRLLSVFNPNNLSFIMLTSSFWIFLLLQNLSKMVKQRHMPVYKADPVFRHRDFGNPNKIRLKRDAGQTGSKKTAPSPYVLQKSSSG
jgi:hypothetical protein